MHLFGPGEGLPLAPSICFICEQSPQNGAIDTGRTHDPQIPTNLRGRKYICVDCAKEFGSFIGMVSREDYDATQTALGTTVEQLAGAEIRVEQLEAVHVETLKRLLAQATTPAVTKKAPTTAPNGG